ncbi:MAG: polyprenyl synthetase family protein [Gemmatimonadetes bacterium]|nr:polyprenyl synthetase family protein [Gemmatimonadota bacterium]
MTLTEVFDLDSYLAVETSRVEAALRAAVAEAEELLAPELAAAVGHGVLSGGKRLRPVLCMAAYSACGGRSPRIPELAAALELIHAYSLMHDDMPCMDAADLRRGQPTTHRVHGEEKAARAGAALIPLAALRAWRGAVALGCEETTARAIVEELCRAAGAGGMVGGQALDLRAEAAPIDGPALDRLHRLKTGALLAASLRIGALAAGARGKTLEGLDEFGRAIGLAFQIADDVLDATATSGDLGKNPSDADRNKTTYVTVHGLEEAAARARSEVARARRALHRAGIDAPALHGLARFVVERRR